MAALLYGLTDAGPGCQVVDRTRLQGNYDFDLVWAPEDDPGTTAAGAQTIYTAIQDQLGLRLAATRARVKALIVEHIERPSPD